MVSDTDKVEDQVAGDSPHLTGEATGSGPTTRRGLPHHRAVAVVYTAALVMSVMDSQIVNVALPTLSRDFHVTTSSVQWIVTSYLMAIAVCVPTSGWLGDRFGTKRMFVSAVAIFTAASLLCAISTSLPELVAMRVLQGAGGGMMVPVGMAMLYRAYPPERRVHVARLVVQSSVLAPAVAPLIGGTLVTYASWRWIFTINLPFGILSVLFGVVFLHEHREQNPGGFDLRGTIAVVVGLALLLYSVGSGPTEGWTSPVVLVTAGIAVAAIVYFIRHAYRRADPVLNIRLLSDRMFRRCCTIICFGSTPFMGVLVFTALYLQEGRGVSAIDSGLTTFPQAIAIGICSQISSRIFPRVGPRRMMIGGFLGLMIGGALLTDASYTTSLWEIRGVSFLLGGSAAFVVLPCQASAFSQITSASTGHGSAIFNTLQRALSALGIAALSTVLAAAGGDVVHVHPSISSFHWVFATGIAIAFVGGLLALRVNDADAQNTMGRAVPAQKEVLAAD
jgi:EmrB/QacA subfamily drug resistance transporter